jgi:hypothetical protein
LTIGASTVLANIIAGRYLSGGVIDFALVALPLTLVIDLGASTLERVELPPGDERRQLPVARTNE